MGEEDGPYQIMPYKEVLALKKDIEELKKKSSGGSAELMETIGKLTKNMDNMLQIFKAAAEEMDLEEDGGNKELKKKLDEIIEQNKIIAEGMVAIVDMVKERLPEKESEEDEPRLNFHQRGPMPPPAPSGLPEPDELSSFLPPLGPPMSPPPLLRGQMPQPPRPMPLSRGPLPRGPMPPPPDFGNLPPLGQFPEAPKKKKLRLFG